MNDSPTARHWARLEAEYPEVYAHLRPIYLKEMSEYMRNRRGSKPDTKPGRPKGRKTGKK